MAEARNRRPLAGLPAAALVFLLVASIPAATAASPGAALPSPAVQGPTTTQVDCSPSPAPVDSLVSCLVTVTGESPTGSIHVAQTGGTGSFDFVVAFCILSGGSCSISMMAFSTGPVVILATYVGDPGNRHSTGVGSFTIVPAPTTSGLACTPSSPDYGEAVSCAASVTGRAPTGTFSFSSSGGGRLTPSTGTCLVLGGTCTFTFIATRLGAVTVNAAYSGDLNYLPSGASTSFSISPAVVSLTLACSPLPIAIGSSALCTASVGGGIAPAGTVTFTQSGTGSVTFPSPASCALSSESCSISVTGASLGALTIHAAYSGDANDDPALASESTSVSQANAATSFVCNPSSPAVGSPITCTFEVTGYLPTGSVTLAQVGGTGAVSPPVASCTLAAGACTVAVSANAAGTLDLTLTYSGDVNNAPGSPISFPATVATAPSTVTVSCSPSFVQLFSSTTCTATVAGVSPTGTIVFSETGGASVTLPDPPSCGLVSGSCSVSIIGSGVGTATLSGAYSGDDNNAPSSVTLSISINPVTSTVVIGCTPQSGQPGTPVTCTATVNGLSPTGALSVSAAPGAGSITPPLTSCTLVSSSCSVSFTIGGYGDIAVTVAYSGDSNDAPSSTTTTLSISTPVAAPDSVSVTCDGGAPNAGKPVQCHAAVYTADLGYAGGAVSWTVSPPGSGAFDAQKCSSQSPSKPGQQLRCDVRFTPSGAGALTVTATYSGDAYHAPASDYLLLFIGASPSPATSTTVSCDQGYIEANQRSQCHATVASADGQPLTGSISWSVSPNGSINAQPGCSSLPPKNKGQVHCDAQFTPSAVGPYTVTATYSGPGAHSSSADAFTLYVGADQTNVNDALLAIVPTSLDLSCDQATPKLGQSFHCQVTVAAADGGAATGTVEWSVSPAFGAALSTAQCKSPNRQGQVQCQVQMSSSESGAFTVTAQYHGDVYHYPGRASFTFFAGDTGSLPATSVYVTCDHVFLDTGQNEKCHATVASADGQPLTGSVAWTLSPTIAEGSPQKNCAKPARDGTLKCDLQVSAASSGVLTVTATYTEAGGLHAPSAASYVVFVGNVETSPYTTPSTLTVGAAAARLGPPAAWSPGDLAEPLRHRTGKG